MVKYNSGCISLSAPVTIDTAPTIPDAPQVVVTDPIGCNSAKGTIMVSTVANLYSFDDGVKQACLDGYCDIYMASQDSPLMRMNSYGEWVVVDFMEPPK